MYWDAEGLGSTCNLVVITFWLLGFVFLTDLYLFEGGGIYFSNRLVPCWAWHGDSAQQTLSAWRMPPKERILWSTALMIRMSGGFFWDCNRDKNVTLQRLVLTCSLVFHWIPASECKNSRRLFTFFTRVLKSSFIVHWGSRGGFHRNTDFLK